MKQKEIWMIVSISLVAAIVASIIVVRIMSNNPNLSPQSGVSVYTKSDVDSIINPLSNMVNTIETGLEQGAFMPQVLANLNKCAIKRTPDDNTNCNVLCANKKCILGMIHIAGTKDGFISCNETGIGVAGSKVGDIDTDCICCSAQ